jgi:ribosomal-protein-alanine N-acetyltransferase
MKLISETELPSTGPLALDVLAPRHLSQVAEIERAGPDPPRSLDDLKTLLRGRHTMGKVLRAGPTGPLAAFAIITLLPRAFVLEALGVHPAWRRRGIGRRVLQQVLQEQATKGRARAVAAVRERNLPAHLFLRACGFRAIGLLRQFFITEDGYHFLYLAPACGGG